jgi:glycine hydroxymethyltransferase
MVPFDDQSPFVTSGIRIGTAALTTRGFGEKDMEQVVEWIDYILSDIDQEKRQQEIKRKVNHFMEGFPLYA